MAELSVRLARFAGGSVILEKDASGEECGRRLSSEEGLTLLAADLISGVSQAAASLRCPGQH